MSRSGRGRVGRGSRDRSGPKKSRSGSWRSLLGSWGSDRARGGADWARGGAVQAEEELDCLFSGDAEQTEL
jgi:hypothetical protein